jgi:hypothetical protein
VATSSKSTATSAVIRATLKNLELIGLDDWDPERVAANGHLCEEVRVAAERIEKALEVARKAEQERLKVAAESLHIRKKEVPNKGLKDKGAAAAASSTFVEAEYCEEENAPPPPSPPVSQFIQPPPEAEIAEITAALSSYKTPDRDTVRQIVKACRGREAVATTAEIVGVIHELGQRWDGPGLGLFVSKVHLHFPLPRGSAVQHKLPTRRMTAQEAKAEAEREEFLRRTLDDMAYARQQREREQQEQEEKQEQELRQRERDRQIREKEKLEWEAGREEREKLRLEREGRKGDGEEQQRKAKGAGHA